MVFLLGESFHQLKLVKKALESFYALGPQTAARMMAKHCIHPRARMGSLPHKMLITLTSELSSMTIGNEARHLLRENIRRLRDIGAYRGRRHAMGLPVRGQKTRTQTETAKKLNKVERRG